MGRVGNGSSLLLLFLFKLGFAMMTINNNENDNNAEKLTFSKPGTMPNI